MGANHQIKLIFQCSKALNMGEREREREREIDRGIFLEIGNGGWVMISHVN